MATMTEPRTPPEGRATARSVTSLVVPPVAWIAALAISYMFQDFTCTAFINADRPSPDGSILLGLVVINAVFLIAIVVAGVLGAMEARRHRGVRGFLGVVGVGGSLLFGLGTIAIAVMPFVLEVCP